MSIRDVSGKTFHHLQFSGVLPSCPPSSLGTAVLLIWIVSVNTVRANEHQLYFGDLHVHTALSFDAWIINTRALPEDAYRYARGEKVSYKGMGEVQLREPLDFIAITDHAEYLGVMREMGNSDSPLSRHELAADLQSGDPRRAVSAIYRAAMQSVIRGGGAMKPDPGLYDETTMAKAWKDTVAMAEKYYEPGTFTTLPGFEWSSSPNNRNLHRNVIFRDTTHLPPRPFSLFDSERPEDLWNWMQQQRDAGATLLAIPHNSNMSGGHMFTLENSDGEPITRAYAETRLRNEPVVEVTQSKGQSMSHPLLAPDEEFAGFELYNFAHSPFATAQVEPGSYVHPGLGMGLSLGQSTGVNPYRLGFIGSSDDHAAAPLPVESMMIRDTAADAAQQRYSNYGSGGLAAVWATENTRKGIYDALVRREAYATTGPRIALQFLGGWGLDVSAPMGSILPVSDKADAPSFKVRATRGKHDATLDRIQIIKGWLGADGKPRDRIFDVAWSGDRQPDERGRIPTIRNTVDLKNATYTDELGAAELETSWTDPDFDSTSPAFYYVRVLQIPTPRWTTHSRASRQGASLPRSPHHPGTGMEFPHLV